VEDNAKRFQEVFKTIPTPTKHWSLSSLLQEVNQRQYSNKERDSCIAYNLLQESIQDDLKITLHRLHQEIQALESSLEGLHTPLQSHDEYF